MALILRHRSEVSSSISSSASPVSTLITRDTSSFSRDDSSSVYSNDEEFVTEKRPTSPGRHFSVYDPRGFLVDFEHNAAYTNPRPAPMPGRALMAARSTPSPPPTDPLPFPFLRSTPMSIPYASTCAWATGPPLCLPAIPAGVGGLRIIPASTGETQLVLVKKERRDRQGYWLASGMLRAARKNRAMEESNESVSENKERRSAQPNRSARRRGLFSRVKDKIRRGSMKRHFSFSYAFPELAKAAERCGHIPAY
jgi:hypothetical protein